MSRTGGIRPEYRLRFGYPYVTIERVGAPPRRVRIDADDPREPLRGFAAEIERVGGRLKAVLPPSEVWRGTVPAQGATEHALRSGAEALGAELTEVEVALGATGADGRRIAAAARRETIAEAQAFLGRAGFGSAEITAAPGLPGFNERSADTRRRLPAPKPAAPALAASGLAAMLALTLWLGPWRPEAPMAEAETSPVATVAAVAAPPAPQPLAEAPPSPEPPAPPPALDITALAPAEAAAPRMTPVVLAGRNMPDDLRPPSAPEIAPQAVSADALGDLAPRPRPASPATELATAADSSEGPRPRPAAALRVEAAAAVTSLAPLDAAILDQRPRARPASAEARTASLDPDLAPEKVADASHRLLAHPGDARAARQVAVAAPRRAEAPNPSPEVMAALAAQAVRAVGSDPRRIAAPDTPAIPSPAFVRPEAAPQAGAAQARAVRAQAPAPQIQQRPRREAAAAQPVRAPAAIVRTLAAAPARVERPQRSAAFGRQPRPARDDLALVGIFGGSDGRHALVQFPNGETERVRQGDDVRGIQVTAIGADAVHLRARGRDTVLKLPN